MEYIMFCGMQGHDAQSAGIHRFSVDCRARRFKFLGVTPQAEPQYIRIAPDGETLYAVRYDHDGGEPGLLAYHVEKDGSLTKISDGSCYGNGPNYLYLDNEGKYLISANYRSGNLCVSRVNADGGIGEKVSEAQHYGHGPNPDRQEKPHVHIVMLSGDDRYLYSCDLGIDKIMVYAFDAETGKVTAAQPPYMQVPDGEGPRHISIHPSGKYAYMVSELGGKLFTYARDTETGALTQLNAVPLVPGFDGENFPSEIRVHPDGRTLYQLNRGHDSVGVWDLTDPAAPEATQYIPSGGQTPRQCQFTPDGAHLVVANQDSDCLTGFTRLPDGTLEAWEEKAAMPRPMSVMFR